jgi:hypothetical protein
LVPWHHGVGQRRQSVALLSEQTRGERRPLGLAGSVWAVMAGWQLGQRPNGWDDAEEFQGEISWAAKVNWAEDFRTVFQI